MNILNTAARIILSGLAAIGFWFVFVFATVAITGEGGHFTVKMFDWEYSAGQKPETKESR